MPFCDKVSQGPNGRRKEERRWVMPKSVLMFNFDKGGVATKTGATGRIGSPTPTTIFRMIRVYSVSEAMHVGYNCSGYFHTVLLHKLSKSESFKVSHNGEYPVALDDEAIDFAAVLTSVLDFNTGIWHTLSNWYTVSAVEGGMARSRGTRLALLSVASCGSTPYLRQICS